MRCLKLRFVAQSNSWKSFFSPVCNFQWNLTWKSSLCCASWSSAFYQEKSCWAELFVILIALQPYSNALCSRASLLRPHPILFFHLSSYCGHRRMSHDLILPLLRHTNCWKSSFREVNMVYELMDTEPHLVIWSLLPLPDELMRCFFIKLLCAASAPGQPSSCIGTWSSAIFFINSN